MSEAMKSPSKNPLALLVACGVGLMCCLTTAPSHASIKGGFISIEICESHCYTNRTICLNSSGEQGRATCESQFQGCLPQCHEDPEADAWEKITLDKWKAKADSGDPEAEIELGKFYDGRFQVKRNGAVAAGWYKKASDQGNLEGQHLFCSMFADEHNGWKGHLDERKELLPEGVKICRKLAEEGDKQGQFMLANLYREGDGVPKDEMAAKIC